MECSAYCSHGGKCTHSEGAGHAGLHQAHSGGRIVCEWPDEESVSRGQADAILARTGPAGLRIVAEQRILEQIERLMRRARIRQRRPDTRATGDTD